VFLPPLQNQLSAIPSTTWVAAGAARSQGQQLCFGVHLSGSVSPRNARGQAGGEAQTLPGWCQLSGQLGKGGTGSHGPWVKMQKVFSPCTASFCLLPCLWVTFSLGVNVHSQPILLLRAEEQEGTGRPSAGWLLSIPRVSRSTGHRLCSEETNLGFTLVSASQQSFQK